MSFDLSKIKWGWVIVGVVIAFVIAYVGIFCVVSVYATSLAIPARGAPDMDLINQFAAANAAAIQSIFIGVGTFVGGTVAARKAKPEGLSNGLAVGVITAVIGLVLSLLGGFNLWATVALVLAVIGWYLGGLLAARRRA